MDCKINSDDRKFLKGELRHILASYIPMLLVSLVIFTAGAIFILKSDLPPTTQNLLIGSLCIIATATFGVFVWNSVKAPLADLSCGTKRIVVGKVLDKRESTNYGWTGNVGADRASQPQHVEYRLKIDEIEVLVTPDDFARYNIGDRVEVHLSQITGKLIQLKRTETTQKAVYT